MIEPNSIITSELAPQAGLTMSEQNIGDFWSRTGHWLGEKTGFSDFKELRLNPYLQQNRRRVAGVAFSVVMGPAVLAACSGDHKNSATDSVSSSASASTLDISNSMPIVEVTDTDLANGGYNCGHSIEDATGNEHYNYSPQIDYLNSKPELIKNVSDFVVNDSQWGMGEDAWKVVTEKAVLNPDTAQDSKVVNASDDTNANDIMDKYAHRIWTYELPEDHEYLNFTCSDAQGNITEVHVASRIRIKQTNHVNGLVFDQAGVDAFTQAVKKGPDGEMTFEVIDMGMQPVPGKSGEQFHAFMVVTEAKGCNNQERKLPPAKQTPTTPATTGTTPPSSTTPSTRVELPPPSPTVVSGGGNGGSPDNNNTGSDNASIDTTVPPETTGTTVPVNDSTTTTEPVSSTTATTVIPG